MSDISDLCDQIVLKHLSTDNPMSNAPPGFTMRDYFAAHAPAEPQKWFSPVIHAAPIVPSPTSFPEGRHRDEAFALCYRMGDGKSTSWGPISDHMMDWFSDRVNALCELEVWKIEYEKQRQLQWPEAWADARMKARLNKPI